MSRTRLLILSVFILSLGLRLVLCVINREANDDHLEVVSWIVDKQEIPDKENCWECFQPKVFYLISAGIIKALHIEYRHSRIICVQLINFIFSFITLLFLWKFINRQHFLPPVKSLCFALVAFNPCLTGIHVQATNDTLTIMAGVLTIYFADLFFHKKKIRDGLWLTFFTILVSTTKGSGIVFIVALLVIFVFKFVSSVPNDKMPLINVFSILFLSSFLIVPFAGGYFHNYQKYDAPFITNHSSKDPPPSFTIRSYVERPGITSVVDGYFTFRYWDMIRQPYINDDKDNYPLHRTSLWSQLYGRTFFMHFAQWPGRWASTDPNIIAVGRLLMILGIFPLLIFLAGFIKTGFEFVKNCITKKRNYFLENEWIYLSFVTFFILFIMKYTYDYRDFSTMKSIFIFPALPAFIKFLMDGFSIIKIKLIRNLLFLIIGVIVLLSIFDTGFIIWQLLK